MATAIRIEIGPGELIDRITILRLKVAHLDGARRADAAARLAILLEHWHALPPSPEVSALADELAALNHRLWAIEDALRACERRSEFGASFVEHARNVYRTNDRRAQLKADIDTALGHVVGDAKVYAVASAAAGASGRRGPGTG
ncbi:MAG: hypothetical protein H6945_18930 [Zoogloeaceae bacterium]|nr:hypothetical protein [Rhodocyclaceae bacterium]MCP5237810.1 hypothetical protein [Zoogloeaceae bacterium]